MNITSPLLALYQSVNAGRRALFRRGLLESVRLPRPVVSVGNLAMGGSGKTPVVIRLVRLLQAEGLRPAILSRGYRRHSDLPWERVTSDDVHRFGDEPVMIARALPGVPVIVGARRAEAAREFLTEGDCDLFVLDDGFQHLRLVRDCDIVILSADEGYRREGESALAAADIVLVRRGAVLPPGYSAAAHAMRLRPSGLRIGGERVPLDQLRERRVFAFSGLANNPQFAETLRALGAHVLDTVEFRDHHSYSPDEVGDLIQRAAERGATPITTEKDWVKIRRNEIAVLEAEVEIDAEEDFVRRVLAACEVSGA